MADNQEVDIKLEMEKLAEKVKEEERKIPVFTVLKNNSILKNIFLIDSPPLDPTSSSSSFNEKESSLADKQELEEILVVGRHPDCNITLEHPSISRFHLRIHSVPSKQSLSVFDLSSVHGTWVCGKKIAPGVQVELQEGDVLQIGGSSRVYRLHWIPLSRAYDSDNPFCPEVEESETVDEKEETHHDDGQSSLQRDYQSQTETDDLLCTDVNIMLQKKRLTPSAPSMPEDMKSTFSFEEETENKPPIHHSKSTNLTPAWQQDEQGLSSQNDQSHTELYDLEGLDLLLTDMNVSEMTASTISAPLMYENKELRFSCEGEAENKVPLHHSKSANLSPPAWQQDEEGFPLQSDQRHTLVNDLKGLDLLFTDMDISEMTSFTTSAPLIHDDTGSSFSREEEAANKNSYYLSETVHLQPVRQFDSENSIPNAALASGESQNISSESSRPQLSSGMSIWKRRGKSASVSVQTNRAQESSDKNCVDLEVKQESHQNLSIELVPDDPLTSEESVKEVFTPDKENCTPDTLLNRSFKRFGQEKRKHELGANSLTSCMGEDDEAAFTPDKENITPNTLLSRSLKKLEKSDDVRHPKTYRSSPLKNADSGVHQVNKLGSSSKGNHVKKLLQENKPARSAPRSQARLEAETSVLKGKLDRVPFQSLLASHDETTPETSKLEAAIGSCDSNNNQQIKEAIRPFHNTPNEENKNWTMVVDAASLLNKESRKALQLMQGLQGTSLIIPRIVIRELDCMKRRGNLFRRTAEVCSALEWIKSCMVNAQSWIHVQSSMEDVRAVAPTPPASPVSLFTQEIDKTEKFSISSVPFSPSGSWLEIVSPTAEDHILECALFFRRRINNGQLVLLSNDVTLKIKAMAEGLLCETAEEFRQSLVNPFSERFLWTDSSPRGPTWSCADDVVLREKYYNGPILRQSKSSEVAKGLKLILLHNSHFRQITSVR